MTKKQQLVAIVPDEMAGSRVDQVMSKLFNDFSRSRITDWIRRGEATVNDLPCKPKDKLQGGEALTLNVVIEPQLTFLPQKMSLNIVHEDEHLLVINKPAGLVVHPAAGNHDGTLLNGLLHYLPAQENLPRAGIVHRLDKETTGLMVVAKTEKAHKSLVNQLQERIMGREYQAVVSGVMTGGGRVDEPIGRHPKQRTKMAVHPMGKQAVTHYRIAKKFIANTFLNIKLETGRTHQIRVHMAHIHYPLVGDRVYAGRTRIPGGVSETLKQAIRDFPRQALHARYLSLEHPESTEWLTWEAPLPDDMVGLLEALENEG